jgi:Dolichyl-phosphate-mannose-protein mannosyltransferase
MRAFRAGSAGGHRVASIRSRVVPHFVVLMMILGGAVYCAAHLRRGWIPHDEGMIGQSAERVLNGELPHRDFDDPYTGGLSYLDAAAFRIFGVNLVSPRIVVLALFVATMPAMYWIAARFLSPFGAAAATLLAVAWGLPNYVAAVPSWYNLCFSLLGTAALLRYVETGRARWSFAAGACGGLSFLAKMVGIYFGAGATLFFLYREQTMDGSSGKCQAGARTYSAIVTVLLVLSTGALIVAVGSRMARIETVALVTPPTAFCAVLAIREWEARRGTGRIRVSRIGRMLLPFAVGFLLPIAIFLVPYAWAGAVGTWFNGVFVLPTRRFSFAALNSAPPTAPIAALLSSELLGLALFGGRIVRPGHAAFVGFAAALVLAAARDHPGLYQIAWGSAAMLIPIVVAASAVILWRRLPTAGLRDQQIAVLMAVLSMCALVQFPFAAPIYFCYVAPLAILALTSLVGATGRGSASLLTVIVGFYFCFAVWEMTPGYIYSLGQRYTPDAQLYRLALDRAGGLLVEHEAASSYEEVVRVVREHAGGPDIWAGPDCPEIYFLSGLRNPTRILFDFFDATPDRERSLLRLLDARDIRAIAVNRDPSFSKPIEAPLAMELAARFPESRAIGRFDVRWRE